MPDISEAGAARQGLLRAVLARHFATDDPAILESIEAEADHVDLPSGGVLIRQGEQSDDVYFVLSGRLRALVDDGRGGSRPVGEIGRGESIGELALFTGEPRSATVVALRDSAVVRVGRADIEHALTRSPKLALGMTRLVIERFRRSERERKPPEVPVTICVLPVTGGVDPTAFGENLAEMRRLYGGTVAVVAPGDIHGYFSDDPAAPDWQRHGAVANLIDGIEAENAAVFLVADPGETPWTHFCIQHADEILLLADADAAPEVSSVEARFIDAEMPNPRARQTLVLLHPAGRRSPTGTARWLDRRPVGRHFHIRPLLDRDMRRLARILAGKGVGLVLSGGGARGFAHIGVARALMEAGIEPDFVGGTSIGAVITALLAMEVHGEGLVKAGFKAFRRAPGGNVTGDYNILPFVSLVKGERTRAVTITGITDAAGADIDMEDTWKTCFVMASDFSTQSEAMLTRGNFVRNVLASYSIPGALPPIFIDGHMMFDGGSFNNFPVDVMARIGAGRLIGVDLSPDKGRTYDLDRVPSSWKLLVDRFRPSKKRRYRLPGLAETLLAASFISSIGKQKQMRDKVDLLFRPYLPRVAMLDWKRYDEIVATGYEHARTELRGLPAETLVSFR